MNNLRAGYQAYTNNGVGAQGTVVVGGSAVSNAVLVVNNNLELGYISGDFGTGTAAAAGFGQVTINTNGTVRANQVTVGQQATGLWSQNKITINNGGTLDVSNNVADSVRQYLKAQR